MLAHKVDGEHPASYSALLLVTQKLERWAEVEGPSTTKDSCNWWIECDTFSDTR